MKYLLALGGLAALLLLASGCPSTALLNTAKPIGDGTNELTVGLTVQGISLAMFVDSDDTESDLLDGVIYTPAVDGMYRRGIGDHFDFGITVSTLGNVGVDFKVNFFDVDSFAISIDPGVSGAFFGVADVSVGHVTWQVPILVDFVPHETFRITLAPRYVGLHVGASATDTAAGVATAHFMGGNASLEIKIGKRFYLMPFGGVLYWTDGPSTDNLDVERLWFNAGIAGKYRF